MPIEILQGKEGLLKPHNNKKSWSFLSKVFAFLVVVIIVSGGYTFYNAKGFSYLSNNPEACNNCHIMNEVYANYMSDPHSLKSNGKHRATCSDCHLPHSFVSKWIAKAQSGVGHGYAFTFKLDELPVNLSANEKSKKIVQQNCINCHGDYAASVVNPTTIHGANNSLQCVSCHENVGHRRGF